MVGRKVSFGLYLLASVEEMKHLSVEHMNGNWSFMFIWGLLYFKFLFSCHIVLYGLYCLCYWWFLLNIFYQKTDFGIIPQVFYNIIACDHYLMKLTPNCNTGVFNTVSTRSSSPLPPPLVGRVEGHVAIDLQIMIYCLIKSSSGPTSKEEWRRGGENQVWIVALALFPLMSTLSYSSSLIPLWGVREPGVSVLLANQPRKKERDKKKPDHTATSSMTSLSSLICQSSPATEPPSHRHRHWQMARVCLRKMSKKRRKQGGGSPNSGIRKKEEQNGPSLPFLLIWTWLLEHPWDQGQFFGTTILPFPTGFFFSFFVKKLSSYTGG